MRCLAVCQDELVIRMLDQILAPSVEVEFLVESRALGKKLQTAGLPVAIGDPKRTDTYLKADVSPQTCIIIEDSGIGIPKDRLTSIFEPFAQVDDTKSRGYEGAGLGLPIARALAHGMDCTLAVESEPGKGTRVVIELPK